MSGYSDAQGVHPSAGLRESGPETAISVNQVGSAGKEGKFRACQARPNANSQTGIAAIAKAGRSFDWEPRFGGVSF